MALVFNGSNNTIGGLAAGGLPDNSVTLDDLAGIARGKVIYGDASGNPAVLTPGSANQVLTSDGTDVSWAAAGGGAFTKIYKKTTTTTVALNSGNDPLQVGGSGLEIAFTPPASTTSYLIHYSGQVHCGTDDGQWAAQFRVSTDSFSSHSSINFVHNQYGFEGESKHRRVENWWREWKPGSTAAWKVGVWAEINGSEAVDITFGGWGGVNQLTLWEIDDDKRSGDWG